MSDSASPARWVEAAQRGDRSAREALARHWLGRSYAVALAVLRRAAEAEDATQEAWAKTLAALPGLRDPERFGPWLVRIVRNTARDALRRRRRSVALEDEPEAPPGTDGDARDAEVLAGWRRLPEEERLVCWLKVVDGVALADIAELLDTSKTRVHRLLHRALARLRKEMSRC